jgi:hypothetical protein
MADEFVRFYVESDPQQLADDAKTELAEAWPGWTPNEGDLEVVLIDTLAPMAANAAEVAGWVPAECYLTILEKLHGIFPVAGVNATGTATFTFADGDSHTIPAGTEIDIDGVAFLVDEDETGTSPRAGVAVTCAVEGTVGNDLDGDLVTMVSALSFVASVALDAPTTGGVDAETPQAFADRGSRELELQGKTLVTARDYELVALTRPGVGRALCVPDPVTREIDLMLATDAGVAVSAGVKTDVGDVLTTLKQETWLVTLHDPTATAIAVTYTVYYVKGTGLTADAFKVAEVRSGTELDLTSDGTVTLRKYSHDLLDRVDAALTDFLSPANWGRPPGEALAWSVEPRVRKNKVIDVISDVEGVDYVDDVTLEGGTGESNGDRTMSGTFPVTNVSHLTGTIV